MGMLVMKVCTVQRLWGCSKARDTCRSAARIVAVMKRFSLFLLAFICIGTVVMAAEERAFDPELAKRLGADERGMKMYILCILKTGPKDAEVKGEERREIFAGHFANIGRL